MGKKQKKYTDDQADFINRTPLLYRRSVVKLFRDFTTAPNKHYLTKPEGVIQELASISKKDVNAIHDEYYDHIQNIRQDKSTTVLKNEELFYLIEEFVWRNCEEEVAGLNVVIALHNFGVSTVNFFSEKEQDSETISSAFRRFFSEHQEGRISAEENKLFKIEFKGTQLKNELSIESKAHEEKFQKFETDNKDIYFAIKILKNRHFSLLISFNNESEKNVYYGVYSNKDNIFLIKGLKSTKLISGRIGKFEDNSFPVSFHPNITFKGIQSNIDRSESIYYSSFYDTYLSELTDEYEYTDCKSVFTNILKEMDFDGYR